MPFIKVTPQLDLTSEQRAEAISYELWAISRPPQVRNPNDVTSYLFSWVKYADGGSDAKYLPSVVDTALDVDPSYLIIVHPENNLTNLIGLFPELSEMERAMLAGFIQSQNAFPFGYIIPQDFGVFTYEEMKADGWFKEEEI
jgi:hypothetical protein